MDGSTDSNIPADISGPANGIEHDIRAISNDIGVAGAVDPDAARGGSVEAEGSGNDDFAAIFAEEIPVKQTRKGGRPKGARNKQSATAGEVPLNINGVEKILFSVHGILAAMTQVPELALDEGESKKLSKSIEGVTNQYKLTLDPKVAAYLDLATTASMIYGPRAFSYYMRKKAEKPRHQQPQPDNVQPIRPVPPNNTASRTAGAGPFDFDPTKQVILGQ